MKNIISLFILCTLILSVLSSCANDTNVAESKDTSGNVTNESSAYNDSDTSNTSDTADTEENNTDTSPVSPTDTEENNTPSAIVQGVLPLPDGTMDLSFLSGAGGWRTVMRLNSDGSFTGRYSDSNMGERGDEYPNGTVYICDFSGSFTDIVKSDEFSYKMTLGEVTTEKPMGEEWISDGTRYISSHPYGLDGGNDFTFYLPSTPIDTFSESFLIWWPYRYEHRENPLETLSCYGIMNVEQQYGFFN